MKITLAAAVATLAVLTAVPSQAQTPPQTPAPPRTCFRLSDMGNHKVADNQTLYVSIRRKEIWRFDMAGSCLAGANFGDPLVLTPAGGTNLICKPLDLDIKVASVGGVSPCLLKSMTPLSPQEAAALPKKLRP